MRGDLAESVFEFRTCFYTTLNYHLYQKLKLIEKDKFIYIIITLTIPIYDLARPKRKRKTLLSLQTYKDDCWQGQKQKQKTVNMIMATC